MKLTARNILARHILERDVRHQVRDWLDWKHIPYVPIEARKPIRVNGQIIFTSERPEDRGIADFVAFNRLSPMRTEPVAIEVKRPKGGRHSDAQKAFAARWRGWGFEYLLVRSIDELEALWPK